MAPDIQPNAASQAPATRPRRAVLTGQQVTKLAALSGRDCSTVRRWAKGAPMTSTALDSISAAATSLGVNFTT